MNDQDHGHHRLPFVDADVLNEMKEAETVVPAVVHVESTFGGRPEALTITGGTYGQAYFVAKTRLTGRHLSWISPCY